MFAFRSRIHCLLSGTKLARKIGAVTTAAASRLGTILLQKSQVFFTSPAANQKNRNCAILGVTLEIAGPWQGPDLIFLGFEGGKQGKPPKKQGFFLSAEPLESLGKKGKNAQKSKGNSLQKKRNPQKKQGKEDQGKLAATTAASRRDFAAAAITGH